MDELITKAFEVHDALRCCVDIGAEIDCVDCAYYKNGCIDALLLDAAKVIGRLIEETSNGDK